MLPSWLSKDAHAIPEPSGVSLQSAVLIIDDNHSENHQDIRDRSTYATPIAQDTLDANPFTTSNVKSLEHSTDPEIFRTPHDDILADLQGYLPLGAPPEQPLLRPDPAQASSLNLGSSAAETSVFTTESLPSQEPANEIMYDPSTGQRLHDYVPAPARSGADEELWSHLSHILELQSEIAKMHVDMENVGLRDARGHNGPVNSELEAQAGTAKDKTRKSRRGNESLEEQEEDDETDEATEGESDGDDEVFGKKKREEEFTRLAERFEKRKVAIDSVMDKVCYFVVYCHTPNLTIAQLDNLSTALKAFHALPTPELDLTSSRTNTMASNTSVTAARGPGETVSAPPHLSVDSPLDIHPS